MGPQLKALVHESPGMKHAVLQEIRTQWATERFNHKARYSGALFLCDLTLNKNFDVGLALEL